MSFCLPLAYWQDAAKKKAARENSVQEPLLGGQVWWGAGMAAERAWEDYPCCGGHAWGMVSML